MIIIHFGTSEKNSRPYFWVTLIVFRGMIAWERLARKIIAYNMQVVACPREL